MWTYRGRQSVASIVTHSSRRLATGNRPAATPSRRRYASGGFKGSPQPADSHWLRNSLGVAGAGTAAFLIYEYATSNRNHPVESPLEKVQDLSKSAGDLSSEFVQHKRSLKSPGVFVWGNNAYRVADPNSKESVVKTPRNFTYFEGQVLRDLKIEERSGAAITSNGDLVQWGKGYSEKEFKPVKTLTGKNLTSLCTSNDRILALSSDGKIYSLPIAKEDQLSGRKLKEGSWVPYWSGTADVSYRVLQPSLKLGERVTALRGGLDHALLLTSSGRVFSVASSTENYPSFGQLGVPGLTWATRPKGPVDTLHEVTALKGSKIVQIAAGDYHSLALDKDGNVFAFGDNSFGQLGMTFNPASPFRDAPTRVPIRNLYRGPWLTKTTRIAAGGANSFFAVDAQRALGPDENLSTVRDLGRITADTWTCGRGIWGALGNGKWTHVQDAPTKVKTLSGLFEYDERANGLSPIRIHDISVGTTHVSAVMANQTHVDAAPTASLDENKDWGFDALWWGGNENHQLGTGKRSNLSKPSYIHAPLESTDQQEARLQIMPRHKGKVEGRTVSMEQRVECGRHVSAIYSAV
ncbi:putative mitochondrial protein Fmp25 [Aspergillus heteromorphus CBS 117.55]|uniref:Putative mitochondrial protein Fmp25 n=1 Tax=Aspergillus heteromorphus CBS 117.55 TaxID=1448321 RepID=A0A317X4J5_9EURO|nr:putative mitochondrial protein Fmp25 [Aspergillus heteromorphus CBS 117.55]PWY92437.1 putative mitochondrial protein Fmp25 [Aspergillus heteromorphus CBS 117.55]